MIDWLVAELGKKLDLSAEELADIIWLTLIRQEDTQPKVLKPKKEPTTAPVSSLPPKISHEPQWTEPFAGIVSQQSSTTNIVLDRMPIKVANPPSLRNPLALARSLRPLMKQVSSGRVEGLDEQATAQQIAEAGIWQPIVRPVLEPWFEIVLVADESTSMLIWRQAVLEFRKLLRNYGAFRDVQLWGLHCEGERVRLHPGIGADVLHQTAHEPEELLDPSGRRLILLITDCVAAYWQDEVLIKTIKLWSQQSPIAIVQVLPEWLWVRTAIRGFESVQLASLEPGVPNSQLMVDWSEVWQSVTNPQSGVCLPIVPLEPDSILNWSKMVMGQGDAPGYWLKKNSTEIDLPTGSPPSPSQLLERFQVMSSPMAQRLMGLLAASLVITLPVIRLIQETLLPKSQQMHVAEVLLGGLLEPIIPPQIGTIPDEVEYRLVDETIRELLLKETPVPDTLQVLSGYIERQFGQSLDEFVAELQLWSQSADLSLINEARFFATITAAVLERKGGKYRDFVNQVERQLESLDKLSIDEDVLLSRPIDIGDEKIDYQIGENHVELADQLVSLENTSNTAIENANEVVSPSQFDTSGLARTSRERPCIALISANSDPAAKIGKDAAGSQSVYVRQVGESLAELGWQVDMFTRRASADDAEIVQHSEYCRTIRLTAGPLDYVLRDELMEHMPAFVDDMVQFQLANDISYLLVHTHYWMSGWVGMQLKKHYPTQLVHTYHSLGVLEYQSMSDIPAIGDQRLAIEQEILETFDCVVPTSPQELADLQHLVSTEGTTEIIPCGTDIDNFQVLAKSEARRQLGLPIENKTVLYVGRFDQSKGIETLVRAIAQICDGRENSKLDMDTLSLLIVGGSDSNQVDSLERQRIEDLVNELGIAAQVNIVGMVGHDLLPLYYAAADVCAVPSHYETSGLVAIEAMACGTPVIASDVGNLQFTVITEETGLLVPSQDVDAFAKAIERALVDVAWAKKASKQAAQRVWDNFSWSLVTHQLSCLYLQLLHQPAFGLPTPNAATILGDIYSSVRRIGLWTKSRLKRNEYDVKKG